MVGIQQNVLLNEKQLSQLLGVTPRALQSWRQCGRGPIYVRISSRCVRYRLSDIEDWLESCNSVSAAEGDRP